MSENKADKLIVAISSRALFDFEAENRVFDTAGKEAYKEIQQKARELPARPGPAFALVQKLLASNTPERQKVEVVLLSRNEPQTGRRVFNSIAHHGLDIKRAFFTGGRPVTSLHGPLQTGLFLSAHDDDVTEALQAGIPAARVVIADKNHPAERKDEIRIAFDGDAVLFSDEAEKVFKAQGLHAFTAHEQDKRSQALPAGPMMSLLRKINQLKGEGVPVRTLLITARAVETHERALHTLEEAGLHVDEAMFLCGTKKTAFLKAWQPDIFFDDQMLHCEPAAAHVPTAHVGTRPVPAPKPAA